MGQEELALCLVAIDGRCGGGKTTLGRYLQSHFGGNLFHMDDFFLPEEERSPRRMAQPGGNVDYARFWQEVLAPLVRGEKAVYQPFDCHTQQFGPRREVSPQRLNIVEGSYSQHPYFGPVYDLRFFVDVDAVQQRRNLLKRNGIQGLEPFLTKWIPMEEAYIKACIRLEENICIPWTGMDVGEEKEAGI